MENCLFCKIVQRDIPAHIVYEDDEVLAFRDINPQAPTHVLVIPKTHVASIATATDPGLIGTVMLKATEIARNEGLEERGYRVVTNHGPDAGQTVFHLHVHVMGGRAFRWPPG